MFEKIYDTFNDRFFDSRLPDVPIFPMVTTDWDAYGAYAPESNVIAIAMDQHYAEQMNTLIHEMIHVEQEITGRKLNHGKFFKRRCREILEELE